ncbi:hypothetical protein [Azospirillum doebereinerae]
MSQHVLPFASRGGDREAALWSGPERSSGRKARPLTLEERLALHLSSDSRTIAAAIIRCQAAFDQVRLFVSYRILHCSAPFGVVFIISSLSKPLDARQILNLRSDSRTINARGALATLPFRSLPLLRIDHAA